MRCLLFTLLGGMFFLPVASSQFSGGYSSQIQVIIDKVKTDSSGYFDEVAALLQAVPEPAQRGAALLKCAKLRRSGKLPALALRTLKQAERDALACPVLCDSLLAAVYHQIGLALSRPDSSFYYQSTALAMRLRLAPDSLQAGVVLSLDHLAGWYAGNWEVKKAISFRRAALSLALRVPAAASALPGIRHNLALLYFHEGEYDLAFEHFHEAFRELNEKGADWKTTATFHENLAEMNLEAGRFDETDRHLRLADSLYRANGQLAKPGNFLDVKGKMHLKKGQTDSAILAFQQSLAWFEKHASEKDKPRMTSLCHESLADAFFQQKNFDACLVHTRQFLETELKLSGTHHGALVRGNRLAGLCEMEKGNYDAAAALFHQSLFANRCLSNIRLATDGVEALKTFAARARLNLRQFEKTGDRSFLNSSLADFRLAKEVALWQRGQFRHDGSKTRLSELAAPVFEDAIAACKRLFDLTGEAKALEEGLQFSELCKSLALSEAFHKQAYSLSEGDEKLDNLLKTENDLKRDIAKIKAERDAFLRSQPPALRAAAEEDLSKKLLEKINALDELMRFLQKDYEELFELKFPAEAPSLAALQSLCRKEESAFVEYFTGERSLFIFAINGETGDDRFLEMPLPDSLALRVDACLQSIEVYDITSAIWEVMPPYIDQARWLYDELLLPVKAVLSKKSVVIVPDGALFKLPFAALLQDSPAPDRLGRLNDYSYFGMLCAVSYSYSASVLRQMKAKKHRKKPAKNYLGIAPDFRANDWENFELTPGQPAEDLRLLQTIDSAQAFAKLLDGGSLLGSQANFDNLASLAPDYRIVHFLTHNFPNEMDSENAFLLLQDPSQPGKPSFCRLWQILHLHLNADLVILSVCSGNRGMLRRTEGLLSQARAFAFAGAKCVLATMWQASESEQLTLDRFLLDELKNSKLPKDKALQNAQQKLMQVKQWYGHPKYWAIYACYGDRSSLF